MYSTTPKSYKLIISETAGEVPLLTQLSDGVLAFNAADNAWYREDRSVRPAVVKRFNSPNITVDGITDTSRLVYTARITEVNGEGDPTITVTEFKNTIGSITIEYQSTGTWYITSDGLFLAGKTSPLTDVWVNPATDESYEMSWVDEDTIQFVTKDANGDVANGLFTAGMDIRFEVYPNIEL